MMADKNKPTGDYAVGYCRPPKQTRWSKDQSGNPKGRGKGTKNLKTDLLEELGEKITIREGGREVRITKQRALIKSQVARALKGSDSAANKIIDLYLRIAGIADEADDVGTPLTNEENAILSNLRDRILREVGVDAKPTEDKAGKKGKGGS